MKTGRQSENMEKQGLQVVSYMSMLCVCLQTWISLCRCKNSDCLLWVEETTAMVFCLGPCRVPHLEQSGLSSAVRSAGFSTTSSCCPLLETTLVINPIRCATIRLFYPTPWTSQVGMAETHWCLCWALLWCDETVSGVGYYYSYSEMMHLLVM